MADHDVVDGWGTLQTKDGETYYANVQTGSLSWTKPQALMSGKELAQVTSTYRWIRHNTRVWVPAKLLLEEEGEYQELLDGGRVRTIDSDSAGPIITNIKFVMKGDVPDLVSLDDVSAPSMLWHLRRRYLDNKFFTEAAGVLIAFNPFKKTGSFSEKKRIKYREKYADNYDTKEPHPYLVIKRAYIEFRRKKKNQSIIFLGESGSGKTFLAKNCVQQLVEAVTCADGKAMFKKKILAVDPILEAFGNARTLCNDNASRFGKFTEIEFDSKHRVIGYRIRHHMLENHRVATLGKNERNFHIFYYLTKHLVAGERKRLLLDETAAYSYLNQSVVFDGDSHDDEEAFEALTESFKGLRFRMGQKWTLYQVASAILNLGNVKFEKVTSGGKSFCKVKRGSKRFCDNAAKMLSVDPEALIRAITEKKTCIGKGKSGKSGSMVVTHFGVARAAQARDALATTLYSKMFSWLVGRVNEVTAPSTTMEPSTPGKERIISMVDMFGFESLTTNSFEQLCINLAAEKLQQFFNDKIFLKDYHVYEREGIKYAKVEFYDSELLLELMGLNKKNSASSGVFQMLDNLTLVPSGKNVGKKFLDSVLTKFSSVTGLKENHDGKVVNVNFVNQKGTPESKKKNLFVVEHFAAAVTYNVNNFVEKNTNKFLADQQALIQKSENRTIKSFFDPSKDRDLTMGGMFLQQFKLLEESIGRNGLHFIRCIKPNNSKLNNTFRNDNVSFNSRAVMSQLRYGGLISLLDGKRKGYPFRVSHKEFYNTYRVIVPAIIREEVLQKTVKRLKKKSELKSQAASLVDTLKGMPGLESLAEAQIGRSSCLYRDKQHKDLELQRNFELHKRIHVLQRFYRSIRYRLLVKSLRACKHALEDAFKRRDLSDLKKALANPLCKHYDWPIVNKAKHLLALVAEASALKRTMTSYLENMKNSLSQLTSNPKVKRDIARFYELDEEVPGLFSEDWKEKVQNVIQLLDLYSGCVETLRNLKNNAKFDSLLTSDKTAKMEAAGKLIHDMRELLESALQCKLKLPDNLDRWYPMKMRAMKLEQDMIVRISNAVKRNHANFAVLFLSPGPGSGVESDNGLDSLIRGALPVVKSADGLALIKFSSKVQKLRSKITLAFQNPEFLLSCEEWQTVTHDVAALSEEIKGSAGFEEGTLQAISDECKAVQGLDLSLKNMESTATQLRKVLRSLPYLQQAYKKEQDEGSAGLDDMLTMLYAEGGYFDKLFKGTRTYSIKKPVLPAGTPLNAHLNAVRLHRLETLVEIAREDKLGKHPSKKIVALFEFLKDQCGILNGSIEPPPGLDIGEQLYIEEKEEEPKSPSSEEEEEEKEEEEEIPEPEVKDDSPPPDISSDEEDNILDALFLERRLLRERIARKSKLIGKLQKKINQTRGRIRNRQEQWKAIINGQDLGFFTIVFDCSIPLGIRFQNVSKTDCRGVVVNLLNVTLKDGTVIPGQAQQMGVKVGDICTAIAGVDLWENPIKRLRSLKKRNPTIGITFQRPSWTKRQSATI